MDYLEPFYNLENFGTAYMASFFMILATEIGDRTFFIAAIMSMQHSRLLIWTSALAALILMTSISCVFGLTAIALVPKIYLHWAVVSLMYFFGAQMLKNGWFMPKDEAGFDELQEVQRESFSPIGDEEKGEKSKNTSDTHKTLFVIALQAFTLTFLAEWGDRSQLATIALAAANSPLGVLLGGMSGHAVCTGLAVIGGRLLANYVSERTLTLIGGLLFLGFAIYGSLFGA